MAEKFKQLPMPESIIVYKYIVHLLSAGKTIIITLSMADEYTLQ